MRCIRQQVHVVGFVGMVITNYSASGNNSWVEGHLTSALCTNNCKGNNTTGFNGTGLAKVKLIH